MSNTDANNELFIKLLPKHDPSIRAYIRASIPDPADVADVMQNVSIIAWKKFEILENPETEFGKWVCVIARYEILKFRRGKARDRLVLDSDIVEKLADEGIEETDERDHWINALQHCLGKLPNSRRKLLLEAYHPESSMQDIAKQMNKKTNALYQILSRLRIKLVDCIEKETSRETT